MTEHLDKQLLWRAKFGFYYYNDHEIFEADDAELESQAKKFANTGINHVMTFSVTHFRWSFQSNWEAIDSALKRIVKAFHKYNIKVTEHHSANFLFAMPQNQAQHDLIKSRFDCRNSKMSNWPGFEQDYSIDREAGEGVSIKSLLQIDGNSGEPMLLDEYHAHYMCPNNPDYVRLYLKYLEEHIYPQGVDGIMTDDISCRCACEHCRKLYFEQTGFQLPECGEQWRQWVSNENSDAYRAWLKFRLASCNSFHQAVKKHYEQLGLRMLRPNYIATTITFTYLPFLQNFDNLPALDWAFQENNFPIIIRYSWPEWVVEAGHRSMVARNRNIPAMSMFYPDRQDTVNFGWALAVSWGHKYIGTHHDSSIDQPSMEKSLRKFEFTHNGLLNNVQHIAKLAVYDSYNNRIIYQGYNQRSAPVVSSWIQAAVHNNLPWCMINKHDLPNIDRYSIIILPEVAVLSDDELTAFSQYVQNGGKLLWIGNNAVYDEHGYERQPEMIAQLLGVDNPISDNSGSFPLGNGMIRTLSLEQAKLRQEKRHTIHERWNKESKANEVRLPVTVDTFPSAAEKEQRRQVIKMLINWAPEIQIIKTKNCAEDLLLTVRKAQTGELLLHIVNAVDCLTAPATNSLGHSDPIPFPPFSNDLLVQLIYPGLDSSTKLQLATPDRDNLELKSREIPGGVEFIIPAGTIDFYGLVKIVT